MARTLSAAARDKMLASSRAIIAEHGLDGYSVEAVAAASGVAKTTVYRHFGSANELLLATVDSLVDPVLDVDLGSVRADLVHLMHGYVAMAGRPHRFQLFTAVLQRAAIDEEFAQLQESLVRERKQPIRLAIQRGIGRGEVDPSVDIETISSMVEGPILARLMHERRGFRPGEIEQIVDLVLRAIAPGDGA